MLQYISRSIRYISTGIGTSSSLSDSIASLVGVGHGGIIEFTGGLGQPALPMLNEDIASRTRVHETLDTLDDFP